MPRTFARITTSIWRSRKFVEDLTLEQQGAYFMLESQGEITAAGTLALTERRWAKLSKGMTPERLRAQLDELERAGHVLIDDDTEEVLVVKFVRFDGGYTNVKRIPVIRDAARAIASPRLRAALAVELADLGLTGVASDLDPDSPPDTPSPPPRNSPSRPGRDRASDAVSPSERVGVTEVEEEIPQPLTATPEGEPSAAASGMPDDDEPPPHCARHPDGTADPCGACGTARQRNRAWHAQRDASQAAARRALAAARAACSRCNDQGFLEHPVTRDYLGRCDHRPQARTA